MDRCRRPNIPGRSEGGLAMVFPLEGDGERCLGREVGRGEGRSHDAALPLRTPIVWGDEGTFLPVVVSGQRDVDC